MKLFIVVACCLVSMALAKPTEECRRNRPKIVSDNIFIQNQLISIKSIFQLLRNRPNVALEPI